jgi:hypothetical protein
MNSVSDIFREVEEEVRRERYEKLWKKYGDYVIAAAALVVIGAAGSQLYRVYEQREAEKASVAYAAAEQMLNAGQPGAVVPEFTALARNAPGGYAQVSRLAQADALFGAGERGAAIKLYEQIADSSDPYLGAAARLHAAWAIADGASRSEVESLLGPLTDPASPWHRLAQEVLAYEDLRAGDTAHALNAYQQIVADPDAPAQLRARSEAMTRFLKAGGDADFGAVPPATPAHAAATRSPVSGSAPVR